MMDSVDVGALLIVFMTGAVVFLWWRHEKDAATRRSRDWPRVEGKVESGDFEVVYEARGRKVELPVFAFSYQVNGEFLGGRFSLEPYTVTHEDILGRVIGRTVSICYNPADPEDWWIPDEFIDDYKVRQKNAPHLLLDYSPRD